jgi:5-methylcytosine-specific restriction protein B
MIDNSHLDLEKSYAAILKAAREQRYISYGDLAAASGVPWSRAFRLMPNHLGQLVTIAHQRGWPMPSAIVVNQGDVQTGRLEGSTCEGFLTAARQMGREIADPDQFVKQQQQAAFEWAPNAPDKLDMTENGSKETNAQGPKFILFFGPVLDALRSMGGEAKPKDVYDWLIKNGFVTGSEATAVNKSGKSKFENKVGWARFYLAKAGLLDDRRRGVWALTPEGQEAKIDHAQALALFREVHSRFQENEAEEEAAPPPSSILSELFDDPSRQFWFVGAAWGDEDQTEKFIRESIWQNGYDEKFAEDVRRMKPGDRIAIKSSFVQSCHSMLAESRYQSCALRRLALSKRTLEMARRCVLTGTRHSLLVIGTFILIEPPLMKPIATILWRVISYCLLSPTPPKTTSSG